VASRGLSRREFLLGVAALSAGSCAPPQQADGGGCSGSGPQWPGHRPCRVYLGLSSSGEITAAESRLGPLGVQRSYFLWDDLADEEQVIAADHANRRLPWVSFKPPSEASGWERVARGAVDHDLRHRARRYATFAEPVVVTFHHEPSDDRPGAGGEFSAAWTHVHDVMRAETGMRNVAFVPIIGEWQYNPRNEDGHPGEWLTPDVLDRAAFVGLDVYQNAGGEGYDERLGRVLDWLTERGYADLMIGVGETGCTDRYESPSAARWWTDSWRWVEQNTDKIGVVAYFDSERNSKPHVYWPLDESAEKQRAFKRSLASPTACRLERQAGQGRAHAGG
jgi:hypothetical protein